jgi:hypothetical protein
MSYVPNFVVAIYLILTYDLSSVDQTLNDSPFYVMWVVGFEVQIATCMSRIPVDSCGQFGTPLHDQDVQVRKGIIGFNFHSEANNTLPFLDVHFSCTLVLTLLTRLLCIKSGDRHYVCEDMKIFNVYVYLSRMVCAFLSLYSPSWVVAVVRR